jgi:hypothetical protein
MEAVTVGSQAASAVRLLDTSASLSLTAQGSNRNAAVALPEPSGMKTATNSLDEMYRQLGNMAVPTVNNSYLELTPDSDSFDDLTDLVWLEEVLIEQD